MYVYIHVCEEATSSMQYTCILFVFTLQAIRKNCTNLTDRFTVMLEERFQSSPNPTWSELVGTLRSPDINCPDIAEEIEDKFIKSDGSSLQAGER